MLFARVRSTLAERDLLRGGERVLVAVSGGADSAALLHALHRLAGELRLTLRAASVDHGLRPDAGRDVEVARTLAARLEVPFDAVTVTTPSAGSTQAAAREARYGALRELATARSVDAIAVGHTLDDQAETVLARLLRGASAPGLAGIAPRRSDGVIRPLLDCRRREIEAHVARFELPFVEDPSNRDPRFTRARIRHALLPALAEEEPAIALHLARLADEAREIAAWIEREAALRLGQPSPTSLPRRELVEAPAPVRREMLARWVDGLRPGGPKRAHVRALERLREGGDVLIGGGWVVAIEGDDYVARREPDHPTRSASSQSANPE